MTLALTLERLPSPIGIVLVVSDREGALRAVDFDDHESRMLRLMRRHYGDRHGLPAEGRVPRAVRAALEAFFAGGIAAIDSLEVKTGGTAFQRQVWAELRHIPAGTTTTYGALAVAIGKPSACRAVGLANGANPVGIVVPCHRVVGADGTLMGYGGGLARKRWLLDHERRWAAAGERTQGRAPPSPRAASSAPERARLVRDGGETPPLREQLPKP